MPEIGPDDAAHGVDAAAELQDAGAVAIYESLLELADALADSALA